MGKRSGTKSVAIFMILLILSMPFYASVAMANDIAGVYVGSKESGTVTRDSAVLKKGQNLVVEVDAKLTSSQVSNDNFRVWLPQQWYPFSGSCSPSSRRTGYTTCKWDTYVLPASFVSGTYTNLPLELYKTAAETAPLSDKVRTSSFSFYIDNEPPTASILDNSLQFTSRNISVTSTIQDQSFTGATGQQCAGVKSYSITIKDAGNSGKLFVKSKDLGPKDALGCAAVSYPNNTLIISGDELSNAFGSDFVGNIIACVQASDKLDQAMVDMSCSTKQLNIDLKAPALTSPVEKSIIDKTTLVPITNQDYIRTTPQQTIEITLNFTEETTAYLPVAYLNASFFNRAQQNLLATVTQVTGSSPQKWTATWTVTTSSDRLNTLPVFYTIIDNAGLGNKISDVLFTTSELPNSLPDNWGPVLVGVNISGNNGWLKAQNNAILIYFNDTPPDTSTQGESKMGHEKFTVSATGLDKYSTPDCTYEPSTKLVKCTILSLNFTSSATSGPVVFSVTGTDDAGNAIQLDNANYPESTRTLKLDKDVPEFDPTSFKITNMVDLGIGSNLIAQIKVKDASSGINLTGTTWNVKLNGSSSCGLSSGVFANNCVEDPDNPTSGYLLCTWDSAGNLQQACFGETVNVIATDLAGNKVASNPLQITTTILPSILASDLTTNNGGWIKKVNNTFYAKFSTAKLSPANYKTNIQLKIGDNYLPTTNMVVTAPSGPNSKYSVMWYASGTAQKPTGFSLSDLSVTDEKQADVILTIKDDFGNSNSLNTKLYVDLTPPVVTNISVFNPDPKMPSPVRLSPVKITARINELTSTGHAITEAYLKVKALDQTKTRETDLLKSTSCAKSAEQNYWDCVWDYSSFNPPSSWTKDGCLDENGGVADDKFAIYLSDKAGNYVQSSSQDNPICGDISNVVDKGQGQTGNFWKATMTPAYGYNDLNRNSLKSSVLANTNGLPVKMMVTITPKTSDNLRIYSFDVASCTSEQIPNRAFVVSDYAATYLDLAKRDKKFFTLAIPSPGDTWLKNNKTNTQLTTTCSIVVTYGDSTTIFNDPEKINATYTWKFTSATFNDMPVSRTREMSQDLKDEIKKHQGWVDALEGPVTSGLDICFWTNRAVGISAGLALVFGWIPSVGPTITGVFAFLWGRWQMLGPFDVTSGKYWCSTLTCDNGDTILSAGLSGVVDGLDLTNIAGSSSIFEQQKMDSDKNMGAFAKSSLDPRTNLYLAWFQLPPCVTGIYTYHKAKIAMLKAEYSCNEQRKLMGGSNIANCGEMVHDFECVYSFGWGNLLLRYGMNVVFNWLKSLVINEVIEWIVDLIGEGLVVCPTGGLTWEPQCYAYAMYTVFSYEGRITDTKTMVKQYVSQGETAPPATPAPTDCPCCYAGEDEAC